MKRQIQLSAALAHPEIDFLAVAFAIIGDDRPIAGSADALGVSPGTVRRWLRNGIPNSRPEQFLKVRDLSGVPTEILIAARMSRAERRDWYRCIAT
ncbi:MAG: hypothetical protein WBY93_14285 [Candidatus Binatus sp.]